MERLGQVVVGPEFQSFDLVVQRVAGRDDDDPGAAAPLFQLFEQPQSAAAGQHDVQQDAVVVVCGDLVEGRGIVGGLLDDILFPDQRPDHDLPQGGFVFDNQYFHNLSLVHGWFPKTRLLGGRAQTGSDAFPTRHHPKTRLLGGGKIGNESERKLKRPRPSVKYSHFRPGGKKKRRPAGRRTVIYRPEAMPSRRRRPT